MTRYAHLVGSVGLRDAETVFTTISDILGEYCPRIPDGETGDRHYWVRWQKETFERASFLEYVGATRLAGYKDEIKRPFYRLKAGADTTHLDFGELGYAREALASWEIFARLADAGRISDGTRFLVSLPTPVALLTVFVERSDRGTCERALERAVLAELERIQSGIPNDRLSIQWDVCMEVVGVEGGPPLHYEDGISGGIARCVRLCDAVALETELGIHICYGDPGHQHIVEPPDLSVSVSFANGICAAAARPIDFVHMPVPRARADEEYFKPLDSLAHLKQTRLVLGLVHYTDGIEGTLTRMATADKVVSDYDIATECGFGRRDPETIPELLRIHRAACEG